MQNKNLREWKVSTELIAGKPFYRAYRLLDKSQPNTEWNREYRGGYYNNIWSADRLAAILNRDEA